MAAEWRSKTENPVEQKGRPSTAPKGSTEPTPVNRMRHPLLAKELLCGTQPADLSLVIVVLSFPPYFAILLLWPLYEKEVCEEKKL